MAKKEGLEVYDTLSLGKAENDEKLKSVYQDWADDYDADNDSLLGTVSQPNAVHLLAQYLNDKASAIIDVGCGTGLVGAHMQRAGFHHFDGVDISEDMLQQAQKRGYRHLLSGSLNERLPLADDSYDACLCVGVFTHGHVMPSGIDELIRITKTGGLICFTVNEGVFTDYGFDEALKNYSDRGIFDILHCEKSDYMIKKDVKGYYCLAKLL